MSNEGDCRRRAADVDVALPHAVYTGVQMLETHLKSATLCHFLDRPVRLRGGTARSARRCSIMRSDITVLGRTIQEPSGYRCTESATPISALCSLSRLAQNCTRPAELRVPGLPRNPAPQASCPCVHLTVTRHSCVLNRARFQAIVPLRLCRIQEGW